MIEFKIRIETKAYKDLSYCKKQNKQKYQRILKLFYNIETSPFSGIGKPEPLRHQYSGYWSRRIDEKNRLIYKVENQIIIIISCKFHYK